MEEEHVITFTITVSAKVRHSDKIVELGRRVEALVNEYDEWLEPETETTTQETLLGAGVN